MANQRRKRPGSAERTSVTARGNRRIPEEEKNTRPEDKSKKRKNKASSAFRVSQVRLPTSRHSLCGIYVGCLAKWSNSEKWAGRFSAVRGRPRLNARKPGDDARRARSRRSLRGPIVRAPAYKGRATRREIARAARRTSRRPATLYRKTRGPYKQDGRRLIREATARYPVTCRDKNGRAHSPR